MPSLEDQQMSNNLFPPFMSFVPQTKAPDLMQFGDC